MYDIYELVDEAGKDLYTMVDHGEPAPVVEGYAARQKTSATPMNLVNQTIADLNSASRRRRSALTGGAHADERQDLVELVLA